MLDKYSSNVDFPIVPPLSPRAFVANGIGKLVGSLLTERDPEPILEPFEINLKACLVQVGHQSTGDSMP